MLVDLCRQCNKEIALVNGLCDICIKENELEFNKCKESPYYYATKYLKIKGKPFTTLLNEKEFNYQFNKLKSNVKTRKC